MYWKKIYSAKPKYTTEIWYCLQTKEDFPDLDFVINAELQILRSLMRINKTSLPFTIFLADIEKEITQMKIFNCNSIDYVKFEIKRTRLHHNATC